MALNYLQICERIVADYGIAGGTGPAAVTGQTGELRNICNWVADAAEHVDNMWLDWKYLWKRYSETMTIGQYQAPAPSEAGVLVRLWNPKRMKIREPGGQWVELQYVERPEFEDTIEPSENEGMASHFTIMPDNSIILDSIANVAYELKGEFWRRPVRLSANTSLPLIPGEFWRIIVARALITYGDREDAPEILSGAQAEFIDVLDKLEADQLEHQSRRRSSTDRMAGGYSGAFPL